MAAYNDNAAFLSINGTTITSLFRNFEMSLSVGDEDVTAGSGTDWTARGAKLKEVSAKATLIYDDSTAAADIGAIVDADMIVPVIYGPEGNATGKPKHNQSFLITGIRGPSVNVDKTLVVWEIDMKSSGTPTTDIYDGGTW